MTKKLKPYYFPRFTRFVFIGLLMACGPAEQKNDEKAVVDSTEIASKRTTEKYEGSRRGIEDSVIAEFIRKYPEMQYAYLPTDDGKITTVKGNFMVAVDGIEAPDDLNKFVRYMEENFESRAMERDEFNKNVEIPAKPKGGYEAYYDLLEQNLRYPDELEEKAAEGTIFVEFVVNESGEVTDVEAVDNTYYARDGKMVSEIEAAAVEAVRSTSGGWLPAKKDGEPVKMKVEIPVPFPAVQG